MKQRISHVETLKTLIRSYSDMRKRVSMLERDLERLRRRMWQYSVRKKLQHEPAIVRFFRESRRGSPGE